MSGISQNYPFHCIIGGVFYSVCGEEALCLVSILLLISLVYNLSSLAIILPRKREQAAYISVP